MKKTKGINGIIYNVFILFPDITTKKIYINNITVAIALKRNVSTITNVAKQIYNRSFFIFEYPSININSKKNVTDANSVG